MSSSDSTAARFELTFIGSGDNRSTELGNSCAVLLVDEQPVLTIDYGFTAHAAYQARFGGIPDAIFITHAHFDHIGSLEALFYQAYFSERAHPVRIFCPAQVVPLLHRRVAEYPTQIAEGGANFWDAFQLCPVSESFHLQGMTFRVFPNRHHRPGDSWGLALPGRFFYSGDTRPIPELINEYAANGEQIFHDLTLRANPSHTGLEDLPREYAPALLERIRFYHLRDEAACREVEANGYRVVRPGDRYELGGTGVDPEHPTVLELRRSS